MVISMNMQQANEMQVLSAMEIEEVSGGLAALIVWALWTAGGAVVGLGAAYIATHWD